MPSEIEARRGQRAGFIAIHAGEWLAATREKIERLLRKHAAPLHGMFCREISQGDVIAVLNKLWVGPSYGQGAQLRGLIERVLMQEGRKLNPATWGGVDGLEHVMSGDPRIRVIKQREATGLDDIPALFAELVVDGSVDARVVAFTLATAARISEVCGADWSEIDLEARTWSRSAARMKAVAPHVVILSNAAVALLGKP